MVSSLLPEPQQSCPCLWIDRDAPVGQDASEQSWLSCAHHSPRDNSLQGRSALPRSPGVWLPLKDQSTKTQPCRGPAPPPQGQACPRSGGVTPSAPGSALTPHSPGHFPKAPPHPSLEATEIQCGPYGRLGSNPKHPPTLQYHRGFKFELKNGSELYIQLCNMSTLIPSSLP